MMDKLSVDLHRQFHPNNKIRQKPAKNTTKKKPMKITYISSPVMVRAATASEFRAIVQGLTGKDSDVELLSPLDSSEGGPVLSFEPGMAANLPTSHGCSAANFPPRSEDRSHGLYVEEGYNYFSCDNSMAFHGFGFDEAPMWRESSEGFVGFQPSRHVSA